MRKMARTAKMIVDEAEARLEREREEGEVYNVTSQWMTDISKDGQTERQGDASMCSSTSHEAAKSMGEWTRSPAAVSPRNKNRFVGLSTWGVRSVKKDVRSAYERTTIASPAGKGNFALGQNSPAADGMRWEGWNSAALSPSMSLQESGGNTRSMNNIQALRTQRSSFYPS